jgi:hypothetical protein
MKTDCTYFSDCDSKELSNCCTSYMRNTDICSSCGEHADDMCEGCADYMTDEDMRERAADNKNMEDRDNQ